MVYIMDQAALNMKENGRMTNNGEMGWNLGLMEQLLIMMQRSRAKENCHGLMVISKQIFYSKL